MKPTKLTYYGVNEVHTYQIVDNIFFAGMNVQSDKRSDPDEIMLMFSTEQILEMYEFLLKNIID